MNAYYLQKLQVNGLKIICTNAFTVIPPPAAIASYPIFEVSISFFAYLAGFDVS